MREKNLIYGGMLVTRIARSFKLLTDEWRSPLSVEPQPHVFKKKSLIAMGVIMEIHGRICVWPRTMAEEEEDDAGDDEGARGDAGQGEAEGSADLYRNMSQDQRASWMYEHTVCQFQYLSIRDNLEPHLQIDPFPRFEANYPPYGYQGHMPPGYTYHPYPPQDGSS
ncbi:hypothetical protein Tco_1558073 [Tanacetum coccineum]